MGLSLSALRGKSWQRLGSRLYRWTAASDDPWPVIDAWHRMLPPRAVFMGHTAAWMHRLDVHATNPVMVALPHDCRLGSRAALDVAYLNVLEECVAIRGIRATTIERTLLDICARSSALEALIVLDMALRAQLTSSQGLRKYATFGKGRPGAARLRSLADLAAPAESPMETRLRWLLLQARLPAPEVQVNLYDNAGRFIARADLYYRSAHLVLEFDGGSHRERLVSDDRRQNSLMTSGYRILRFTAADLYGRPDALVAQVRTYLSGR